MTRHGNFIFKSNSYKTVIFKDYRMIIYFYDNVLKVKFLNILDYNEIRIHINVLVESKKYIFLQRLFTFGN